MKVERDPASGTSRRAAISRILDGTPLFAWVLLTVAVELILSSALAALTGVPRGGSGARLARIAALCAPFVEEAARFLLAAVASQRGFRGARSRLVGFLMLFLVFENGAYLLMFLAQGSGAATLSTFAAVRAPSVTAHVIATLMAIAFVAVRAPLRWILLGAAMLIHLALNLVVAPQVATALGGDHPRALSAAKVDQEAWIVAHLAVHEPKASRLKVLRFASSPDGQSVCGVARLGRTRSSTFAIMREGAGDLQRYRVMTSPGIDGAPDPDQARRAAMRGAIEIEKVCVKAGVYRPAGPQPGPPL